MKLNYTIERPSTLLAAVCAPSASWLPESAPVALVAVERAPAPQAHQIQIQAELVRTLAVVDGSYGTTGFVGSNGTSKRMTDGASGVPPRGRPV
ncbi:hypothetical protein ACFQFC_28095 [Amorphoplanes digitatis]|uniref:Uncharacterized protein n=1 Tax=Actinoplanes digitatis TaxID=1868 RepID=A0A7W7HSS9_9ACTN|nr:hypothetical protein [Actinoplanes digitatis]MBB4760008.1 hypothetical protein [Actinoplanes digitatis]GID95856.1 hypothetical protein Adi01nite_52680 [Actinoplanes digitatis]